MSPAIGADESNTSVGAALAPRAWRPVARGVAGSGALSALLVGGLVLNLDACRRSGTPHDESASQVGIAASKTADVTASLGEQRDAGSLEDGGMGESRSSDVVDALELEWLPDGARILVGGGWILDASSGMATAISFVSGAKVGPNECLGCNLVFSPSGRRAVLLDNLRERLSIGPAEGPFRVEIPIPQWGRRTRAKSMDHFAFWVSERVLFVEEFDRTAYYEESSPRDPTCRILDTVSGKWSLSPHPCISGDYVLIWGIECLAPEWVGVYSAAEGLAAVRLAPYDSRAGARESTIQPIGFPGGPLSIRAAPDGSGFDIVSVCRALTSESPFEKECDSTLWALYFQPIGGGPLQSRRSDLPPGSVMDPKHERFAWPRGSEVCVGDPRDSKPRCFPLPHEKPAGRQ